MFHAVTRELRVLARTLRILRPVELLGRAS